MEKICRNCHWFKPNSNYSHAISCLDTFSKVKDTETCENFITTQDYKPTGIWAGVAELVEAVAKEVEKREKEGGQLQ